jgi:ABC-2 type transport system ATP-binding protein
MAVKPIIEISKLVKKYKSSSVNAVDSLNLHISEGSIFGLLGPNGAGKTTTISMLCGLLAPTSGKIKIAGHKLNGTNNELKRLIGIVPQELAVYEDLTAKENLEFFGNMYGLSGKSLSNQINHYLGKFNLKDKSNKRVNTFSGGMKRRLNLIAGILHSPKILFLDEPTVGIDVQSKNVIIEHLKNLNANGMTLIYTSHMMDEAESLCSRIAIIDFGKVISVGKPKELINEHKDCKNLEEIFLKLTGRSVRE